MRRRFSVRPVTGSRPQACDPPYGPTTDRAVEDEPTEFALKVGLHLEELEAERLRVDREGMGTVDEIGKTEVEVSLAFTKEILKATYQYAALRKQLAALKREKAESGES